MIPILTFKPVLIGCQYGLFVVYGAFYLVNQLIFHCFYQRIAECLGRNFRPDLSGILSREGITPVVILIFADISRMLWKTRRKAASELAKKNTERLRRQEQ